MLSSSSATAAAGTTSTGVMVDGGDVLGRCCLEMEEALSYSYREGRVGTGSIDALEIRVVRPGTLEEVTDYAVISRGASVGRYKVPRCVTSLAIVELLDSCVVSSHLSHLLWHWDSAALRF